MAVIDEILFRMWQMGWLPEQNKNKILPSWISVKDEMPKEHDSIFKKLYGTDKWSDSMWQTQSDKVLVTIKLTQNGKDKVEYMTDVTNTHDGKWFFDIGISLLERDVIAWMPLPSPYVPDTKIGKLKE